MRLPLLAILFLTLTSCRVGRSILYNVADIRDHRKFPSRPLTPSPQPFRFIAPTRERGPRTMQMDGGDSIRFDDYLKSKGTLAFLVIHKDTMVYERYFSGYEAADVVPSFSVAKSVTSLLIGCAIADGFIRSVEQPVTDFVPELKDAGFDSVTIRHALQQTTGLRSSDNYYNPFGDAAGYYYGTGLRKKISRMELETAPGKRFEYTSTTTQLLGLILERALKGKTVTSYAQEKLWTPLGAEHPASWSIDQKKDGMEKTFCCINATARDYAKIGRLMLRNGAWNGQQIIPASWVRESTTTDTTNGAYAGYKYQWWLLSRTGGDYMAQGLLGQYIYVNPVRDVVIVRLGRREGKNAPWSRLFRLLAEEYGKR